MPRSAGMASRYIDYILWGTRVVKLVIILVIPGYCNAKPGNTHISPWYVPGYCRSYPGRYPGTPRVYTRILYVIPGHVPGYPQCIYPGTIVHTRVYTRL